MNRIGFHTSIAGGIVNAPSRAAEFGCETFQCFTRSPQGGPAPIIDQAVQDAFHQQMEAYNIDTFYIHAPYYINFASLIPSVAKSSERIVREELERGTLLGARYVMAHPGSHRDQSLEEGLEKVITGVSAALQGYVGSTEFLIEISAGSGFVLGDTFDEVGEMVRGLASSPGFGGVCFDTCHAFAAGYDFRTPEQAQAILEEFDTKIGLKYLKVSHVQDCKVDLNGKRDRHEHIGEGYIGTKGLASLLSTPEFAQIDWLLETEHSKLGQDIEKLKEIRANLTK